MNLFEKAYKDKYSKYNDPQPIPPGSLDPFLFYFPEKGGNPTLLPIVKSLIERDIDTINSIEAGYKIPRVEDYIIVGPILQSDSSDKCPVTVKVKLFPNNLTDLLKEHILNCIKELNNRLIPGTQHPVQYIPTIRPINLDDYEAAYHPYTEKWLKKPKFLGESLDKEISNLPKPKKKSSLKRGIKKLTKI